jgi:ABC-type phosphate transport system substrate-binding protein
VIIIGRGIAAGIVVSLGLAAPAQAKTVADFWQVSVQMPPQLWDDAASLPNIAPEIDAFTIGSTKYRIRWTNVSIRQLPKYMLRLQGGRTGTTTAGLYDRAVTTKQLKKFGLKQRLLWLDADVLLADATSPVCQGLTDAQLSGVLDGSITNWSQVFADWSQPVSLRTPTDSYGKARQMFGRKSYAPTAQRTTDGSTLSVTGGAVAVQKLSYAGRYLTSGRTCAVPIDGVTPSEQTTRDRSYKHAYGVYYVSRKKPTKGIGAKLPATIKRWESLLFGQAGDEYLTSAGGRVRFLP